jgi:hopene-associated glycosyltransferase HpnB
MIALLALAIWVYLFFFHGHFWASGPELPPALPAALPDVDIVIPARDEAETIAPVIASLLAQDYAGKFRVILVDDGSTDGTAERAASAGAGAANAAEGAGAGADAGLTILSGAPKPPGWSGKLWALSQGIAASASPVILLADADIVHDPRHLSALMARLVSPRVDAVSEMVRLNCESLAERALVPAFVYFFQTLYPFASVNDPLSPVAAAAGGTILLRREALARIGGIAAIKGTLIDDVALATALKRSGAIFLGHSGLATSIRPYPKFADIFRMVSRTAFTQLRYSAWILAGTLVGLTLVWLVPIYEVLFGHGWHVVAGLIAFALAAASYMPTLQRYQRSQLWAAALPLIALFYMAATIASAVTHWRGTGATWKNRAYGPAS